MASCSGSRRLVRSLCAGVWSCSLLRSRRHGARCLIASACEQLLRRSIDMRTIQERFTFTSGGESMVGTLYVPEEEDITGLVVTTGPLTSVKEQAAGVYARAMAERGLAAVAFDHRGFGESGGKPRQFESPRVRIEDIRKPRGGSFT